MIIDSHLHIDVGGEFDEHLESLLSAMDRVGIQRTCLMQGGGGRPRYAERETIEQDSRLLMHAAESHPDRFYPMLWVNPCLPFAFLRDLVERTILNGPICGIKLSVQMNARDPRLEPFAGFLQEHDVPVLFHSWYKTVEKRGFESDPSDLASLARRFPGLRILVAHITGGRYRGIQDIRPLPNMCVDTSGSQPEDGYLEYGLENLGPDRVLFGSDHPGRDLATQLGRIESLELDETTRENVLWRNAVRFFEGEVEDA